MKKLTIIFALLLIALTTAQTNFAQQENEKEMIIKAARFLEEKPFDKDAKKIRSWAFVWGSETKDVTVTICGGKITEAVMDKKAKFGSELLAQYAIAMTAFKLQNPGNTDENAAQLAGLESVVKTYETMLAENKKAKTAALDELVAKRNSGELANIVREANCGKK